MALACTSSGIAEHGQLGHAAQQQLLGRGQDAVVAPLREHDVPAVRAGPLQQGLLEHQRGDPVGRATASRSRSS